VTFTGVGGVGKAYYIGDWISQVGREGGREGGSYARREHRKLSGGGKKGSYFLHSTAMGEKGVYHQPTLFPTSLPPFLSPFLRSLAAT